MIKRGCDIIGLPIVCKEEGSKHLEVKDILYCNEKFTILGFLIEEGNYFHGGKIIPFEHAISVGKDALIIRSEDDIQVVTPNEFSHWNMGNRQKILGLEVISELGQSIGIVQDIMIDMQQGKLMGLILSEGLFHDLVEGRAILPVVQHMNLTKETLIISSNCKSSIQYNTGGLKKLLALE